MAPDVADEGDRYIEELCINGIKLHPSLNSWTADYPLVYLVMEMVKHYGLASAISCLE